MSLLKSFANTPKQSRVKRIDEDCGGAVGAGAIAGNRGLLFSAPQSMIKRFTADFSKNYNTKSEDVKSKKAHRKPKLTELFATLRESDDTTTPDDVMAKLKSAETKEKAAGKDVVAFGVEDDEGHIVRVTVRADQAAEFETALQRAMAELEDDDNQSREVAEILYNIKNDFDIVDITWPDIQEDEEQGAQQFGDGEQGAPGEGGDELSGLEDPAAGSEGDMGDLGDDAGGDLGDDMDAGDQTQDLLGQVIDMMKADAEARKADAEARKAEARQREQEMGAKNSIARIKQEEQMLDMDEQEKAKKAEEKEAKRLAQLSRWKSQMSAGGNADATSDYDMNLPSDSLGVMGKEENEERTVRSNKVAGRLSPADLARRILGGK